MSSERMADPTVPLAERVQAALLCWDMDDAHRRARAELLADVAAADRLGQAGDSWFLASSAYACCESSEVKAAKATLDTASVEYIVAVDAYRARMAQGVDRG